MQHRIRRQVLDLELPREEGAIALQRQAGRVFQEKVLPKLDELFSRIAPADRIVRIDFLEIDLGNIGASNWEKQFVERCIDHISKQVTQRAFEAGSSVNTGVQTLSAEDNALTVFHFFLQMGALPWYAKGLKLIELENLLHEAVSKQAGVFSVTILPLLQKHPGAFQRLVWQFSLPFSIEVIETALRLAPGWVEHALQIRQSQTGRVMEKQNRLHFLQTLLSAPEAVLTQPPGAAIVTQFFSGKALEVAAPEPVRVKGAAPAAEEVPGTARAETEVELPVARPKAAVTVAQQPGKPKGTRLAADPEGVFVEHAGLVLLGVYLPAFFSELQLVAAGAFHSIEHQHRAIHLLHFLATGLENPEEPVLVLPKILCGLELEEPVPLELELSDFEKSEALDLLKAVVQNWPALKNTSPEGLQEGFLRRSGHLLWSDTHVAWILRPERLGLDMLLERLPWSISVIKMPWMQGMVQVEW